MTRPQRGSSLVVAVVATLAVLFMVGAASAEADDGSLAVRLDQGVINLGADPATNGVKIIDPSLSPPDPPATINLTLSDTGDLSTPPAGFSFPVKRIEALDAGLLTVDATIEISAEDDLSGTFDPATGGSSLSVPAQAIITIYQSGTTTLLGKCAVQGFTLGLATTGTLVDPGDPSATPPRPGQSYPAAAFAPPENEGAFVASWASLPPSVFLEGLAPAVCEQVDGLLGGPGAIWLSGTAIPSTAPVVLPPALAPEITTKPPASTTATTAEFAYGKAAGESQQVDRFQCRLDSDAGWTACGSGASTGSAEYTGLASGSHEFEVRAGNDTGYGPAASYEWTVAAAPEKAPALTATPPEETTATVADFSFSKGAGEVQEVNLFQCRLDSTSDADWSGCGSGAETGTKQYTGLAVGGHTFEVRAGNAQGFGPVTSYAWTIEATPPSGKPRFAAVKVTPKARAVKRGKKAVFKVTVRNAGQATAKAAKVCLKAPRQIKAVGGKCKRLGNLAAGRSRAVKFKVKPTRKAKVGKKHKLVFAVSAKATKTVRGKAAVRVKR